MSITVSGTLTLDGKPLKRTFVEIRLNTLGIGVSLVGEFAVTDNKGNFKRTFSIPVYAAPLKRKIDIRIYCQNTALRVLESGPIDTQIYSDQKILNGGTLDLTSAKLGTYYDHFRLLAQGIDVYDRVWRQLSPYNLKARSDFPLGRSAALFGGIRGALSVRDSFSSARFVEITYPAFTPGLTYVEPADPNNSNLPLVHVQDRTLENRVFGERKRKASLLPHELGHVYHFAAVDLTTRLAIAANYVGFIVSHITHPYHNTDLVTTKFIAFIEAIGMFSERFYFFATEVRPNTTGASLRSAFVDDELSTQSLVPILGAEYTSVGTLDASEQLTSALPAGDAVEGRVYGALLHLAKKLTLKTVVEMVVHSQATTFDAFKKYVIGLGDTNKTTAINQVASVWFT